MSENTRRICAVLLGVAILTAMMAAPAQAQRDNLGLMSSDFYSGVVSNPEVGLQRAEAFLALSPEERRAAWAVSFESFLEKHPHLNRQQLEVIKASLAVGTRTNWTLEMGSEAWLRAVAQPLATSLERAVEVFPQDLLDRSPFRQGTVQAYLLGLGLVESAATCNCTGSSCGSGSCTTDPCLTQTVSIGGIEIHVTKICSSAPILQ